MANRDCFSGHCMIDFGLGVKIAGDKSRDREGIAGRSLYPKPGGMTLTRESES